MVSVLNFHAGTSTMPKNMQREKKILFPAYRSFAIDSHFEQVVVLCAALVHLLSGIDSWRPLPLSYDGTRQHLWCEKSVVMQLILFFFSTLFACLFVCLKRSHCVPLISFSAAAGRLFSLFFRFHANTLDTL